LWNNLDKFHPANAQRLSWEDGIKFNSSYGDDKLSILQREIVLLKPKVIVFVVGNGKYTASLASAFSLSEEELKQYEPNPQKYVSEISDVSLALIAMGYSEKIYEYTKTIDHSDIVWEQVDWSTAISSEILTNYMNNKTRKLKLETATNVTIDVAQEMPEVIIK
jgi:hypothetical protein